jgi:hypothetical protein
MSNTLVLIQGPSLLVTSLPFHLPTPFVSNLSPSLALRGGSLAHLSSRIMDYPCQFSSFACHGGHCISHRAVSSTGDIKTENILDIGPADFTGLQIAMQKPSFSTGSHWHKSHDLRLQC